MKELVVQDIMTRKVVTVNEEDNLLSLRDGMDGLSVRHLPVVDDGTLVGLITQRDLLRLAVSGLEGGAAPLRDRSLAEQTFVADVMTRDVRTIHPTAPLSEAVDVLVETKFGCLPVVDGLGALVGILTEHDLLLLLQRHLQDGG